MKKNGFTLVELLAVIVILALLITVAVPNVINMSSKTQNKMFCTKVETIEKAAQMWGNDNYDSIVEQKATGKIYDKKAKTYDAKEREMAQLITVKELVQKGYQKKDDEKAEDGKYVLDPRDNDTSLMDKQVLVYINNSRVYAKYQFDNIDDAKSCNKK